MQLERYFKGGDYIRIDEIATCFVERVEECKGLLLVALAHELFPLFHNVRSIHYNWNCVPGDEAVEAVHDFLDGGGEVPPVQVEDVDVVGLQLLEAVLDGDVHGFEGVADEVGLDGFCVAVVGAEAGCVFCRDSTSYHQYLNRLVGMRERTPAGPGFRAFAATRRSRFRSLHTDSCLPCCN